MDDNDIIQLYWDRNEQAIRITSDKYGHYCKAIARNILNNEEDAEECVNDTYLNAWNSMPTHWPKQLETFQFICEKPFRKQAESVCTTLLVCRFSFSYCK